VANDRVRLVRECLTQLGLKLDPVAVMADLDWSRARLIAPEHYERATRAVRRRSTVPSARFTDLAATYAQLKQRRGVVDFDDLLTGVLQAMSTDPTWAEAVRWRFRHLFVDEAQDLNPLQHAVLEVIRANRSDLCLVGDPRQAIYGWNGADPLLLAEVERHYPGITVIRLETNYRCSPQVVRAGAAALHAADQVDESDSHQPSGAPVLVRCLPDERQEAAFVAQHVQSLLHHRQGADLAILARTNDQLTALQAEFQSRGIPTERSAGRSSLDIALQAAFRCVNRDSLAEWADSVFAAADSDHDDAVLRRVAEEADAYLTSGEAGGFRAWVEARTPFDRLVTNPGREAVALLTFHAAKGREWWGVVVTGAEDGLVPHGSAASPAELNEEARLFYVALTRAAEHLVVTHATTRGGKPTQPSRWLSAVLATASADAPTPPPTTIPSKAIRPDPLAPYRDWRAAVAKFSGQPERAVCSDKVLRSLMESPTTSTAELAARLGITESAAARLRPLPQSV
jgi:DNA helicase-2/ATP-dependent DNA helicase PcrA